MKFNLSLKPKGQQKMHMGIKMSNLLSMSDKEFRGLLKEIENDPIFCLLKEQKVIKMKGFLKAGIAMSLKEEILADTKERSIEPLLADFLVPDDYFCLWPKTFYDDKIIHIVPELNPDLRKIILNVARASGLNPIDTGIYVQTRSPRFETKAEIKFLQAAGDVVGMTMADEATIGQELDLPYASLCSIDNYCNGIIDAPLTFEEMKENSSQKIEKLKAFLIALLEE